MENKIYNKIYDKFDEQFDELVEKIIDWNERSVLIFNGEKFDVIHDFGNTSYHLTQDIRSPELTVKTFRSVHDTSSEDDFWRLLYRLADKLKRNITSDELRKMINEYGGIAEVAEKYGIDMNDVIQDSARAEIEQYLFEIKDEIVEAATEIYEKIQKWAGKE